MIDEELPSHRSTNKQKKKQTFGFALIISSTRKDDRSSQSRKGWGVVWEKRRLAMVGEWVTAKKKRGSDRGGGWIDPGSFGRPNFEIATFRVLLGREKRFNLIHIGNWQLDQFMAENGQEGLVGATSTSFRSLGKSPIFGP